ncbi:MAG: DUF5119 domain-containing protein [Rikenellaceae bacterium]
MNNFLRYVMMFALLATVSCERQTIYDPAYLNASIPITIDWSASNVDESDINNVSIYFYPTDGSDALLTYSTNPNFAVVYVPEGEYNILIHNEMIDNMLGLSFDQTTSHGSFSVLTQKLNSAAYTMFYTEESGQQLINESEAAGAWSYEGFEVTRDMIEYTRSDTFAAIIAEVRSRAQSRSSSVFSFDATTLAITYASSDDPTESAITRSLESLSAIQTEPRSAKFNISVAVQNLNSAQYAEGVLRHLADGVVMSSGELIYPESGTENYNFFKFTDYTYDDSTNTDGVMTYDLVNSGIDLRDATTQHIFHLKFLLHTGVLVEEDVDITDQLTSATNTLNIDINIGNQYNNGTTDIVLPESTSGGFTVDSWGEIVSVPL